jgi:hypothetical protein
VAAKQHQQRGNTDACPHAAAAQPAKQQLIPTFNVGNVKRDDERGRSFDV